jgi:hypothetical protein
METVRALADLSALSSLGVEARMERLLGIGCEQFRFEAGLVLRVVDEACEVTALRAPGGFDIARGARFPSDAPWCRLTFDSARPYDVADVSASGWPEPAGSAAAPFQSYLGAVVRSRGEPIGILAFAGRAPRSERFTASEKDLLTLMARWLGRELEHGEAVAAQTAVERDAAVASAARRQLGPGWKQVRIAPPARERAPQAPAPPPPTPPRASKAPPRRVQRVAARRVSRSGRGRRGEGAHRLGRPGALDLNSSLRRLEPRLRRALGDGPGLELKLVAKLEPAATPRIPLDAVVLSLVGAAARALGRDGRVEIATADLDVGEPAAGVLPAVAPDHYVTIGVWAEGNVDPDALASAYEPTDEAAFADRSRLSLPTLYRLLQHAGGDLSVEVERGRSARFTVFLPRARRAPAAEHGGASAFPPPPS